MKKYIYLLIILSTCFTAQLATANYSEKLDQALQQEIVGFFQRNIGNKLTSDLMDAFILHINKALDANRIIEKPKNVNEKKETP
jgi:predicted house-cleaning noncanonical NTP pyrophosphatase (MazG superfamily)